MFIANTDIIYLFFNTQDYMSIGSRTLKIINPQPAYSLLFFDLTDIEEDTYAESIEIKNIQAKAL